jgi:putative methionine-R-sulfoxide reductase with GAF domain
MVSINDGRWEAVFPILFEGRILGVLIIDTTSDKEFDRDRLIEAEMIALYVMRLSLY